MGFCGRHPECIPSFQNLNRLQIFVRHGVNITPMDQVPTSCLLPAIRNNNMVDARTCKAEHLALYVCTFLGTKMTYGHILVLCKCLTFL